MTLACGLIMLFLSSLARADVVITQLANEGVLVTDGRTRVLIDAMVVEPYSIYAGLPEEVVPMFDSLSGPFSRIDLVLASHRHHDHNQPRFACRFMQSSRDARLISSPQVLDLMREKCREFVTTSPRVREINPQRGQSVVIELKTATLRVFPLSHGTRKYARIQNFGHLLELGGVTVLHIGDAAMDEADFVRAGLDTVRIDVALIPFWYFQPGPGQDLVDRFMDAPLKIAVHIPPSEMGEVSRYLSENHPSVMILDQPLGEARFSASSRQPH
jgi:L-ascorbate metabolism protein UlaG (beta-lactamase superfamily)